MTENMIVTIISGVLALIPLIFNAYRESKLKRITDERTKWREEIRKIANELSDVLHPVKGMDASYKLYNALNQLKVRINSYGKNSDDVHKGFHIWKSIETIEKVGLKNGKEEIQKLIVYLSLLLKFDWERSKKEASMNYKNILGYSFSIIAAVLYVYLRPTSKQISDVVLVVFPVAFFAFLIWFPHLMMFINDQIGLKKDKILFWILHIIIIIVLCFVLFIKPGINGCGYLAYPLLLLLISEICIAGGDYSDIKAYNKYKEAVYREINEDYSEKNKKIILKFVKTKSHLSIRR